MSVKNLFLIKRVFLLVVTLLSFIGDYFFGSYIYSTLLGKVDKYYIGKNCAENKILCEQKYFPEEVLKIQFIRDASNEKIQFIRDSSNKKIQFIRDASNDYIGQLVIEEGIIMYEGNCPCPYDYDKRGNRCGGRSSYSKNGRIKYCYSSDVPNYIISSTREKLLTSYQVESDKRTSEVQVESDKRTSEVQVELNKRTSEVLGYYNQKYTLISLLIFWVFIWVWVVRNN